LLSLDSQPHRLERLKVGMLFSILFVMIQDILTGFLHVIYYRTYRKIKERGDPNREQNDSNHRRRNLSANAVAVRLLSYYCKILMFCLLLIALILFYSFSFSRSKVNLNLISHNAAIDLIRFAIDKGFNIAEVRQVLAKFSFSKFQ
jgi:hypothetical protein